MSKRTDYFRVALIVIAWIIFAGLGIEAGAFLTHSVATLLLTPEGAKKFWAVADLSKLYHSIKATTLC